MYIASDITPFVQQSQNATDFFIGSRSAFTAIRKAFGNWASNLAALFAVIFLWFFLRSFKNALKKSFSTEVSLQDYPKIRLEYDRLNKIFEKTGSDDLVIMIHSAPWLLRGSLRLFQDIIHLISQRRDAIGAALAQINASAPLTDLLQPVSETDLWTSRAKVYDYRF